MILLDALMPGMDGFATCRRLEADAATRDVPVIFMTGLTETEHVFVLEPGPSAVPSAAMESFRLTPRELEVLGWVSKGKTNRDIGQILGMSPRTVNKHLEHIYEKLCVETRTAAAAMAMRIGGGEG